MIIDAVLDFFNDSSHLWYLRQTAGHSSRQSQQFWACSCQTLQLRTKIEQITTREDEILKQGIKIEINTASYSKFIIRICQVSFKTKPKREKNVRHFVTMMILTMAMSCLAAGFSTVVTSFRVLESEALISERSWELGLVSAIMSWGKRKSFNYQELLNDKCAASAAVT